MKRNGNNRAMMASKTRIPEGWRLVRLGDVAEANRSGWSRSDDATILYLDLTSIVVPGIMSCPKELAAAEAPSRARRRVHSGDILVSTVRPNLRGFARVREAPKNLIASTGFAVLTPMSDVDGSYVYHHVMTQQFADYLEKATTGQAYPAVRPADVTNFVLPIPPLPEQRSIAAVLDSIDDAIERTDAVITATEQLRDSLLHQLLTRGVPGWHTAWKDVPGLGTIPAAWEVVRLGEVCAPPEYGASASARPFDPKLPRYVRITDITDDGRLRKADVASADPSAVDGYELGPGDLLFARSGATVGKTYLYRPEDGPCVYAGYLIRFRPLGEMASAEFLERFTRSQLYWRWVESMFRAGAQPNINAAEYSSLPVVLPPMKEQQAIAATLDGVDATIAEAKRERDGLQLLKESAADALLLGRVRVEKA